jgi:hypothetical protein
MTDDTCALYLTRPAWSVEARGAWRVLKKSIMKERLQSGAVKERIREFDDDLYFRSLPERKEQATKRKIDWSKEADEYENEYNDEGNDYAV